MAEKPNTAEPAKTRKSTEFSVLSRRRLQLPLLLGCVIVVAGIAWLLTIALFVIRASTAPGIVVAVEQSGDSSAWYATFTFTDAGGVGHKQRTWFLSPSNCPAIRPGGAVTVLYEANAPKSAKIDSFATIWFGPLFIVGLGSLFAICAAAVIALGRRVARIQQANMAAQQPH